MWRAKAFFSIKSYELKKTNSDNWYYSMVTQYLPDHQSEKFMFSLQINAKGIGRITIAI